MTSKSSSSTMKALSHRSVMREITMRRLWVVVFTLIPLLFLYPFGTLMVLGASRGSTAQFALYGFENARAYLSYRVANYIGSNLFTALVVGFLGLLIGLQGFAYLFSVQQVDFFEAQPMSRRQRFLRIYAHGLILFTVSYVVCAALSGMIAAGAGTFSEPVWYELLFVLLRDLTLFFAVYSTAALAAMLTGNLIYAIGMSLFLLCFEYLLTAVIRDYMSQFFRTFSGAYTQIASPLSVPFHLSEMMAHHGTYDFYGRIDDVYGEADIGAYYGKLFAGSIPHALMLMLAGLIAFVLAYIAYQKRKSESAGATLCSYPLHVAIKFAVSVTGGLVMGSLTRIFFYGYGDERGSFFRLALIVLIFTGLIAMILEAMYRRSVRGAAKSIFHVPVVMSLAYMILLVFQLDIIGYDRFIPTEDKVESYAIISEYKNYYFYYGRNHIDESGSARMTEEEFIEKYMYLTDVDAAAQLVFNDREAYDNLPEGHYEPQGYQCTVLYRMKGGKKKYRRIVIPYDTDEALMERVVGSEPYKTGIQQVCHDQAINEEFLTGARLLFDSGFCEYEGDAALYPAFADCYRADLAGLTYHELKTEQALGFVELIMAPKSPYQSGEAIPFVVYPSFEQTVAFLRAHDMYGMTDPAPVLIDAIEAECYLPPADTSDEDAFGEYETMYYDDPDVIAKIMDAAVYERLLSGWYDMSAVTRMDRVIIRRYIFHTKPYEAEAWFGKDRIEDYGFATRYLLKDRLPEELMEYVR